MIIIPIYNTIILPEVRVYFKKEMLAQLDVDKVQENEDVIFVVLKEGVDPSDIPQELEEGDYYPIGIRGRVLSIDDKGGINIDVISRVTVGELDPDKPLTEADRPGSGDLSEEESARRLEMLKGVLLNYVKDFQWGLMARGFITQWHALNEVVVGLSPFLDITNEEKYAILAVDSEKERADLIEKAVRQFMAVSEVMGEGFSRLG